MIQCVCYNVNDKVLLDAIKEAPILSSDPYSTEYSSDEDQVLEYVQDKLNVGNCDECKELVRDLISVYRGSV